MRLPRQPQFAIWIERNDYDSIKALSPEEPDWPDTYDEWLQRATEQIAKTESRGVVVDKMVINPQEFAAYCKASGIEPNNVTLGAFAIVLARRQKKI